ncbi:probable malonyl-CoA-acyl carrier protein transacylase, mitochondrial [Ceratina calcarata]|uniref:Probable malonyl-CoA-acyl carrier protein transacylase, mitochondrial n=1 Tax=Ceratina calcarata TaxID=156304 RepID=A0AAJ7N9W5_9HYME|nr:probable malonyl-CoA-acyl carrier protein transacylase, mitochondrial [Ceratina calcarata]
MLKQSFRKLVPARKTCLTSRISNICNYSTTVSEDENPEKKDNENSRKYRTREVSELLEEAATFSDIKNKEWATSPYVRDAPVVQPEEPKATTDPADTSVFLFPGQGTLKVGMVNKYVHYPGAKELFDIAKEIINYDLLRLCLEGPQEKLNRTEYNQIATVVSSLAALEKIREENSKIFDACVATAGYSVGEITSLILSGAITFEDGVRLVWTRGKAMQLAANMTPQGMMSVSCLREAKVAKACTDATVWARDRGVENPVCKVAIFVCTERKILAGNEEALGFIQKHAKEYGLTNVTKLPVSGAFHTPLMEPALKSIFDVLKSIEVHEPRCKVYSNYRGMAYGNLRYMKKYIWKQIVSPVKWEQCVQNLYQRPEGISFPQTYDIGSEGRMKTILRLINAKASRTCTVI